MRAPSTEAGLLSGLGCSSLILTQKGGGITLPPVHAQLEGCSSKPRCHGLLTALIKHLTTPRRTPSHPISILQPGPLDSTPVPVQALPSTWPQYSGRSLRPSHPPTTCDHSLNTSVTYVVCPLAQSYSQHHLHTPPGTGTTCSRYSITRVTARVNKPVGTVTVVIQAHSLTDDTACIDNMKFIQQQLKR